MSKLKQDLQSQVEWKHFQTYQNDMSEGKRFTMQELKNIGGKFKTHGIKHEIMQYGLKTAIEDIKNQQIIKDKMKDHLLKIKSPMSWIQKTNLSFSNLSKIWIHTYVIEHISFNNQSNSSFNPV